MTAFVRLIRNTLFLMAAEIVKPFISFLLVVYISRQMGIEGMGQYNTVLAYLVFFEYLGALGLQNLIVRDTATIPSRAPAYLSACLTIGAVTTGLTVLLLNMLLGLFGYDTDVNQAIRLMGFGLPLIILTGHLTAFFEGLQRMEYKAMTSICEAALKMGLGVLAIRSGGGLIGLIAALLVSYLVAFALALAFILKLKIIPAWPVERELCRKLVRQSVTFLLITFIATVYWKVDVLMLAGMQGMKDVGSYSAAYRLMEILKGFSYSYIAALFPLISSSYAVSQSLFRQQCLMSIRYLFLLSFPVCIGTTILAEDMIVMIYGEAFASSGACLQILIWILCLFPATLVFARALVASHRQSHDLVANILGVVFIVALNYFLIPAYGFMGAAAAALISIGFFMLVEFAFFSRSVPRANPLPYIWKPLCAGLLMGALTFCLRSLHLFLLIPLSAGIYVAGLLVLRTFSTEEMNALRVLWRQKRPLILNRG
jgi:O-antigen/teichoic acid export membrane protein